MNYCLGTVQFGQNYGIQGALKPDLGMVYEMIDYSIRNDIHYFDTAAAYGDAEKIIGNFNRIYPDQASKMKIISKMKPDAFQNIPKSMWENYAEKYIRESLSNIGVNKLYAYLFHNASYLDDKDAVEAIYTLKENQYVDSIGVSIYSPEEAMKALSYREIEVIQIPYNVFDRRLDQCGFFDEANKKNVKIFARSSLLQGLLMMDSEHLPKRVKFSKKYLEEFDTLCRKYKISKLEAAIGYVGSKQSIDYIVFGVDNINQLQEYLALKNKVIPDTFISDVDSVFKSVEEKLVNPSMWEYEV